MQKTVPVNTRYILEEITSALGQKTLMRSRDCLRQLHKSGKTMLFEGEVSWMISLPETYKTLNGTSESLDTAFVDLINCLNFLSYQHNDDTRVHCAVDLVSQKGA